MPTNSHLPSLLRNLTSSSSRPTASISLDSPSSSQLSNDDTHSIASHSSKSKTHGRRRRVVTDPVIESSTNSPTTTSPTRPRLRKGDSRASERDREVASDGSRSRSDSGSSLEGLTARLHGARKGKKKSKDSDLGDSQEIETQHGPKPRNLHLARNPFSIFSRSESPYSILEMVRTRSIETRRSTRTRSHVYLDRLILATSYSFDSGGAPKAGRRSWLRLLHKLC